MRYPTAALAILLAFSVPALAQQEPRIATLNANGMGSVAVVPDIAIVTIGVVSRAESAREALDANNAELTEVIATIRGEGVKDTDIGTSGFSVSPVYDSKPSRSTDDGLSSSPVSSAIRSPTTSP